MYKQRKVWERIYRMNKIKIAVCVSFLLMLLVSISFAKSKITKEEADEAWRLMSVDMLQFPAMEVKKGLLEKLGEVFGVDKSPMAWNYGPTKKTVAKKGEKVIQTVYERLEIVREVVEEELVVAENAVTGEKVLVHNMKTCTYRKSK